MDDEALDLPTGADERIEQILVAITDLEHALATLMNRALADLEHTDP
ncbi:hypothetical protein ACQPYK_36235 [Streptosporangium sp. CA-135522]